MAIEFETSIEIERPVEKVFAVLDDVSQAPRWLATCAALEKLTPGPNQVGTKLRYVYQDASRTSVMTGQITEYIPNERLAFEYAGDLVHAVADFRLTTSLRGTHLQYLIEITPQTFLVRMFSAVIRRQAGTDTAAALERLRELVEAD